MNAKRILYAGFFMACQCFALETGIASLEPSPVTKENTKAIRLLNHQLDEAFKSIHADNRHADEYMRNVYKERTRYYRETIREGGFLFASPAGEYVTSVYNKVLAANNDLGSNLQLFVSRSGVPNAYNSGDGNLVVNIGLLPYLENEAQLAFVICHELAHQYLEHTKKYVEATGKKFYSYSYRNEYNKAIQNKYNVNARLEALALPGTLALHRYSRVNELEADSMGMVFLSHTDYRLEEAITGMDVLERCNRELDTNIIDFRKHMNPANFPFQDAWLHGTSGSSLGTFIYEKDYLEDSLKTHPDVKLRKAALESMLPDFPKGKGSRFLQPEEQFRKMQCQAIIDLIHSCLLERRLDRPIFLAMLMQEHYPEQVYPVAALSNCFALLSLAQKQRRMNEAVDHPGRLHEENYNRLLALLFEIRSTDCAGLAYALAREIKTGPANEDVSVALLASAYAAGKTEEYNRLRVTHLNRFPEGRYAEEIEFLDQLPVVRSPKK